MSDIPPENPEKSSGDEKVGLQDALREQQAIAAAQLIGEEMRREDRQRSITIAKRLVPVVVVFLVVLLLLLFAYYRMAGDDFNPLPWAFGIAILGGITAVGWYLATAESRRKDQD